MQVQANSIHSAGRAQAVPEQAGSAATGKGVENQPGKAAEPVDTVKLSDAAQSALTKDGNAVRGKSANSPAHRARELLTSFESAGGVASEVNFGQLVSRLARGLDTADLLTPPEDSGETDSGTPALDVTAESGTDIVDILQQAADPA